MMPLPMPLHRSPAAAFDEPFAMLAACHERVVRMLGLLQRLRDHLCVAGADRQARDAARDVMRYFDIAAPLHHEDEEHHVFPRLRANGLGALADRLHADHLAMGPAWSALRADLVAVAEGRLPDLGASRWEDFCSLYRSHLAVEDGEAFPRAEALADVDERAEMGAEMAQRRGL